MSLMRSIDNSIAHAMRGQSTSRTQVTTQQFVNQTEPQGTVSSIDDDGIAIVALASGGTVTGYSGSRTVTAGDVVDAVGSMLF